MDRVLYATDASMYEIEPLGVLIPRTAEDVRRAVRLAAEFDIPVLPRGGGSSLAGQTVGRALVIDFSRHLDEIHEINAEEGWVRLQPGVVLDELNETLRPYGLMVGPDPASSNRATLGGMVANNSTGTHSILYGHMVDHVRSAHVILSDGSTTRFENVDPEEWAARASRKSLEGRIYRKIGRLLEEEEMTIREHTPPHWRRSGGYRLERLLDTRRRNLAHLLCSSEGTLAIATELSIDLVPRPEQTALGVVHFNSRRAALEAVSTVLETNPSAVELFDRLALDQCRDVPEYARRLTFTTGSPEALLITEYYGDSREALGGKLDELHRQLERVNHGYAIVDVYDDEGIDNVWEVRKAGLGLVMGVKGDLKPLAFVEDAAVPVEHLPEYVAELEELFRRTNTRAVIYAHASGGCLHVRPFIDTKDPREVEKMKKIARTSMELVKKYGGDISSEHGNGLARSWLNRELFGPELYNVYRETKNIFDPDGIFNPGKKVDAPPMTENLRMGPSYETISLDTYLDFSEDEGFDGAIEMCNGSGVCRKMNTGTMCPSFMVTRDEEDSTRGRANALRAAMSGTLAPDEFTGERMYEVMDLCIACKACKSECPSAVDMAKIKTEWLQHYWDENGLPLRERFFAYLPKMSRWLSGPLASIVNWLQERPWMRRLMDRHLGISEDRQLPAFARESFTAWYRNRYRPVSGKRVVLFQDTFNDHHLPETSRAAYEFLTGIGYSVVLANHACCGRAFISKGLVKPARKTAHRVVRQLAEHAEAGVPIVGLEPSCILTLRDEYKALLHDRPDVETVAAAAVTFEEFVAQCIDRGELDDADWRTSRRRLLVHGHCHQKSLVGMAATEKVLSYPPGYDVSTIDSGCCGMAGSFGYEAEHVEISRQMAERRLAPAVREAGDDTIVVASGMSCRSQIKDTTGRDALHPAEVLRDALNY
jgi:FAD/FMN-containing dehydrogenase/Fe-S oxidoreductase